MSLRPILTAPYKFRNLSSVKRDFTLGLSEAVFKVPNEPVGPGAAKNTLYKNPEYFCYDKSSYFEAEVEMLKFRCPQPSTKQPYFQKTQ